jgi:hypothetical protein
MMEGVALPAGLRRLRVHYKQPVKSVIARCSADIYGWSAMHAGTLISSRLADSNGNSPRAQTRTMALKPVEVFGILTRLN